MTYVGYVHIILNVFVRRSQKNYLNFLFSIVLGFDERKDWTKQANGKQVQECHITFTDQTDYVDQGTVEPVPKNCTKKFQGSENCFKEVWKVAEKTGSEQSTKFIMCDGCNTNT